MKTKCILTGTLLAFCIAACNKPYDKVSTLNETDEAFIKIASMGNYNEIDAGQMAASKGTDSAVKQFGRLMIMEHQTTQNELRTLAANKSVGIQESPDAMHVTLKSQLMQMSGRQFDSAYIHSQVSDHQTVLNLFKNELNNGKDQDVKQFANKYLPHIQMHYNRADSIASQF